MEATRELSLEELRRQSVQLQQSKFFSREEAAHMIDGWLDQFVRGNLAFFDAMPKVLETIRQQTLAVDGQTTEGQKIDEYAALIAQAGKIKERVDTLAPGSEEFEKLNKELEETLAKAEAVKATINMTAIQDNLLLAAKTLAEAKAAVADAKERYSLFGTSVKVKVCLSRFALIAFAFGIAYLIDWGVQRMQAHWPGTKDSLWIFIGIFLVGVVFVDPLNAWITRRIYLRVLRDAEDFVRAEILKIAAPRKQLIADTVAELHAGLAIPNISPEARAAFEEILRELTE